MLSDGILHQVVQKIELLPEIVLFSYPNGRSGHER